MSHDESERAALLVLGESCPRPELTTVKNAGTITAMRRQHLKVILYACGPLPRI
jgi:hypothetical protein